MKNLLLLRDAVKVIYGRYQVYIQPAAKFILAFILLSLLNGQLGYLGTINNIAIVLVVALMASFLPINFTVIAVCGFILGHLYAVGLETLLVGFLLLLLMLVFYFRYNSKDTWVVLLLPICLALRIPFVIPIAVGLLATPLSGVAIAITMVGYYFIQNVNANAVLLSASAETEIMDKVRLLVDGLIRNKEMIVTIAAFVIIATVVYVIRRLSIENAWTIATFAGGITGIIVMLVGSMVLDINVSVLATIFGSLVSAGIGVVIQFFAFHVDYSRVEKVQFEDDEYYYYVKAVPKITVSKPEKEIHKINETKRTRKVSE